MTEQNIVREYFLTSEKTDLIDAAMAQAQAEIEGAARDSENPYFHSKYADLASVKAAIQQAAAKAGISYTQWPVHSEDGMLHLITRLAHKGQWYQAEMSIKVSKADPQGYVAATTYARRCALAAAFGVAPEDDDGNQSAQQFATARENGMKIMKAAAKKGMAALTTAFKSLDPDVRNAISAADRDALKKEAELVTQPA